MAESLCRTLVLVLLVTSTTTACPDRPQYEHCELQESWQTCTGG